MSAQKKFCSSGASRWSRYHLAGVGVLGLALAGAASAASPLGSGGFDVGLEQRTFDGATFDVVRLTSPMVTLSAYSFGAWIPVVSGADKTGLVLRHSAIGGVSFQVAPIDAAHNLVSGTQWNEYVAAMRQSFGETATLGPVTDSSVDRKVVQILGWTTREASFVVPQPEGREPYVEQHVVVSGEGVGIAFVLSGTQSQIEAARRDFRFFLSRLDRKSAPDKASPGGRTRPREKTAAL